MAKLAFHNARLITPTQLVLDSVLLVHDQKILGMVSPHAVPDEFAPIDIQGAWLAPGFIDIHVHGAAGADTLDGTVDAIKTISERHLWEGTTSLLPTAASASADRMCAAIQAVREAMSLSQLCGRVLGIHLEGPFLSPRYHGAHTVDTLRVPAQHIDEWQAYINEPTVKLITLAPELEGSEQLIKAAVEHGIHIAAGHTDADYALIRQAAGWGVNQCSHLFNAMLGLHQREPGTVGAVLAMDSQYAQFIADGLHLHPAVLRIIARCKGAEKGILISDAVSAAGMPDGTYSLGDAEVVRQGNAVYTADGHLAGSTLSMAEAVRNMVKLAAIGLQTAVQMATLTPAQSLGIDGSKGSLNKGRDADLVVLNDNLEIVQVWSRGQQIR